MRPHLRCRLSVVCAISKRYTKVCNSLFSVDYMYIDHLKFYVVCINGRSYVCCTVVNVMVSLMSVMSTHPPLCNLLVVKLCFYFRGGLDFLDCDDICMCVFNSVYVELKYDEISLTFTAGSVCLCSHVVVLGLSVRLSWYPMGVR